LFCNKPFARRHDMLRHERTVHSADRNLQCQTCKSEFQDVESLNTHCQRERHQLPDSLMRNVPKKEPSRKQTVTPTASPCVDAKPRFSSTRPETDSISNGLSTGGFVYPTFSHHSPLPTPLFTGSTGFPSSTLSLAESFTPRLNWADSMTANFAFPMRTSVFDNSFDPLLQNQMFTQTYTIPHDPTSPIFPTYNDPNLFVQMEPVFIPDMDQVTPEYGTLDFHLCELN
jgi:hypothetical protein